MSADRIRTFAGFLSDMEQADPFDTWRNTMTLEDQLRTVMHDNNLTHLSLHVPQSRDYYAAVHGPINGLTECAHGANCATASEAVSSAVSAFTAKRKAVVAKLAPMEIAA